MRRNILVALSAALALLALPSLASAHSSSSSDDSISTSSSLLKRNSYDGLFCSSRTVSLCAHNTQDRCSCKPTCGGQETECPKPKHADRGHPIYYGRRCSIECNSGMELNNAKDDCKCKPNWVNKGTYCEPPSCPENEVFDHKSNTCICIPGCDRFGNNNRCRPNCGNNEEWKNGQCRCIPGYEFNQNGKCKVKCDASEHLERKNGECHCMPGYEFNNKGKCKPRCDANEHLEFKNGSCQCIPGYKFNKNGKCKPQCDANEHLEFKNGGCQCMDGFKWKHNQCVPSCEGKNMEWNGKQCVCMPGCKKHPNKNWCEPPQCRDNEVYNGQVKQCVCKPGYKRTLWGFCVPEHPHCGPWSYWNGHECVCKPGCKKNGNDHCTPGPSQHPHPNPPHPGGGFPSWPFPGNPGGGYPHPHPGGPFGPFAQGNTNGGSDKEVKKEAQQQPKQKRSANGVPVWSSKLHTRDQDALFCPDGLSACPISASLGGYECVDTTQELENCGGCAVEGSGVDCTTIPGVEGVGCNKGQCVVFSCSNGFRLSTSGTCVRSLISQ